MNRAYQIVVMAYLVSLIVACIAYFGSDWLGIEAEAVWERLLIADIAATLVIFGFSFIYNNSSFYDAYWSVAPMAIWIALCLVPEAYSTRLLLCGLVVMAWGARLTYNWSKTWDDLSEEDWRYRRLQENTGRAYWLVSLLGIHLFPTILVFTGCIGMIRIAEQPDAPLNWLDALALLVGAFSIWVESRADAALHAFRGNRTDRSQHIEASVWQWCRHPNYLGEIGVWVSIGCFGIASVQHLDAWVLAGPAVMILLFTLISIPMIEKKLIEDKPSYRDYQKRVPMLLPYGRLWG